MLRFALAALLAAATLHLPTAYAQETLPQEEVLGYVEQLVQWQRDTSGMGSDTDSPREMIFGDALSRQSVKALRSGFKFARLHAATTQEPAAEPKEGEEVSPRQRLQQRTKETTLLIAGLRKQLATARLSTQQRAALQGRLQLAIAREELLQNVLTNISSASSGDAAGLGGRLDSIAREIPELAPESKTAKPAEPLAVVTPTTTTEKRSTNTIVTLSVALFDITRKQSSLRELEASTDALESTTRTLLQTLRTQLDSITGDNPGIPLETQLTNYKQIGSIILPLGDALFATTAAKSSIQDWQNALDQRTQTVLEQLGIKLAILGCMLAVPLLAGEALRRAIARYVVDPKRKRQANTARRIVVSIMIVLILLLTLVNDFSSFATFAGFLTAGLAVALQGVLLSFVAHFFFYGRHGVRAGDRVHVGGVTGEILQIGMVRLYLRELKRNDEGTFEPTGKTVAFPNSILFQPSAFYKYAE